MKSKVVLVVGGCMLGLMVLTRCNLQVGDDAAGRSLLGDVTAKSLSRRFVQVSFGGQAAEGMSLRYGIFGQDGSTLAIHSVTARSDAAVLLETEQQAAVTYQLVIEADEADGTRVVGATGFLGSVTAELALATAIPLSSSQVLVVFESQIGGGLEAADFVIDGLGIEGLTLDAERISGILTTSNQSDRAYRIELLGTGGSDLAVHPLKHEAWFSGVASVDERSPTVKRTRSVGPTAVLVEFTEKVRSRGELTSLFSIRRTATSAALLVTEATLHLQDTHLLLTTGPQAPGAEYELHFEAPGVSGLSDLAGNAFRSPDDFSAVRFIRAADPGVLAEDLEPRLVGAFSTGNASVRVAFNKGMGDTALDPAAYTIVTSNVNPEAAGLAVVAARFLTVDGTDEGELDRTRVELTTLSQSTVEYTLRASGLFDASGSSLGPARLTSTGAGLVMVGGNETTFFGSGASGEPTDTDGDGLSDAEEQVGWVVEMFPSGSVNPLVREVTSDPARTDTDEDGLSDAEEKNFRSDPRDLDTDDEGVSDVDEARMWGTSLTRQDTDGDAVGIPLNDARELKFYKTSARLSDTDGDGLLDGDEILSGNRDPRVANLPDPGIEIGQVAMRLDTRFSYTDTEGESRTTAKSTSATLQQSSSRTFTTSDATTNQLVITAGVEGGYQNATGYFKANVSGSYTRGNTFTATQASNEGTQEQYQESLSVDVSRDVTHAVTRTVEGASVELLVTVNNRGDIPFTVRNLEITGLVQDSFDRGTFLPLATLLPASASEGGGPFEVALGPFIPERGPFIFKSSQVFPSLVEELMKSPRGVIFNVANFDIEDEDGRNFAFITQDVNDRTASLVFDLGNGEVDRFRVSTHSPLGQDGRPRGITMRYALQDILRLKRNEPVNAITVGSNGCGETSAIGDDEQVVIPQCPPVPVGGTIIEPGPNGILDTEPVGDDHRDLTTGRTIVDGGDGCAHTRSSRDDIQVVPGGCVSASPDGIMVRPGPDGLFQTSPRGDDELATVTGYGTEPVGICDGSTPRRITPGDNAVLNSILSGDDIIEVADILPGLNGVLESTAEGDDVLEGPGLECRMDRDCPSPGRCKTVERLTRYKGVRNAPAQSRFWIILSNIDIAADTDFHDIVLHSGDAFSIAYVEDKDGDGLLAREEFLYGSSDRDDNSDGCPLGDGAPGCDPVVFDFDTVRDFEEVREGWNIAVEGQRSYFAFPDPVQPDTDADRLFDDEERALGSDPGKRDTDDDEIRDDDEVRGFDVRDRDERLIRKVVPYQSAFIGPGPNGLPDSQLIPDDVLSADRNGRPIVTPGPNGVLDTRPEGDDVLEATKLILDGGNGKPETLATGDDVQVGPAPSDTETVTVTFLNFHPHGDACDDDFAPGEFEFDFQVRKNTEMTIGSLSDQATVGRNAQHSFASAESIETSVVPQDTIWILGTVRELDAQCGANTKRAVIEPGEVIVEPPFGGNGLADTTVQPSPPGQPVNDDVQEVPVGAAVLPGQVVISPGPNGILDTAVPGGDDVRPPGNGFADTLATGNDEQRRALGQPVAPGDIIVSCGTDGEPDMMMNPGSPGICQPSEGLPVRPPWACLPAIIQSSTTAGIAESSADPATDDQQRVALGAPVEPGVVIIDPGPNGMIDSQPASEVIVEPDSGNGIANSAATGDDIQVIPLSGAVAPGQLIVAPGPDGVLDTIAAVDDINRLSDDELMPASVPADLDCALCPLGECVVDCALCPTGACTGDDVLLVRDPGQSCEDGSVCPCGSCVVSTQEWRFSEVLDVDDLADDSEIEITGGEGCFSASIVRVRIEHATGAMVEPGAVLVRSGPDGELDTETAGDDIVGAPHMALFATNPLNRDTDGDTLDDGAEVSLGANPNDPLDASKFRDNDLDGLANIVEQEGWFIGYFDETDRTLKCRAGTEPVNCPPSVECPAPNPPRWIFQEVDDESHPPPDCEIVTSDRFEPDTDFDGLPDLLEYLIRSDPGNEDTDGDGILDLDEFDPESRFSIDVSTRREFERRCADAPRCTFTPEDTAIGTNVVLSDTDADGRDDRAEVFDTFTILPCIGDEQLPREVASSPLSPDADRDGVLDGDEFVNGTDPGDPDTDDDGKRDDPEIDGIPDGCGKIVSVSFSSYVLTDPCDGYFFGWLEGEFNFWLYVDPPAGGPGRCNHNQRNVSLDSGVPHTFGTNVCRFNMRPGEQFTIGLWPIEECDDACNTEWKAKRTYSLETLPVGDVEIKPRSGDTRVDECFNDHKLTVKITVSQG